MTKKKKYSNKTLNSLKKKILKVKHLAFEIQYSVVFMRRVRQTQKKLECKVSNVKIEGLEKEINWRFKGYLKILFLDFILIFFCIFYLFKLVLNYGFINSKNKFAMKVKDDFVLECLKHFQCRLCR